MNTTTHLPAAPLTEDELASLELQEAVDEMAKGIRDPEKARRSRERMDRMREELRQRVGILNVAVDLIREGRDEE